MCGRGGVNAFKKLTEVTYRVYAYQQAYKYGLLLFTTCTRMSYGYNVHVLAAFLFRLTRTLTARGIRAQDLYVTGGAPRALSFKTERLRLTRLMARAYFSLLTMLEVDADKSASKCWQLVADAPDAKALSFGRHCCFFAATSFPTLDFSATRSRVCSLTALARDTRVLRFIMSDANRVSLHPLCDDELAS